MSNTYVTSSSHSRPATADATPSLLLVGGTFDEEGGRASGYFRKFAEAVAAHVAAPARIVNGGSYQELAVMLRQVETVSHLFWFVDIPNELPKLLPELKVRFPHLLLVQSKNNRAPRQYTRAQLFERMRGSSSAFLLEFTLSERELVTASLLAADGRVCFEQVSDVNAAARLTADHVFGSAALATLNHA